MLFLGGGFYLAYRPTQDPACGPGDACGAPASRRRMRGILWLATLLATGAGAYPYLAEVSGGAPPVSAAQTAVTLDVSGMTCAACVTHVKQGLEQVSGVVSATVLYPEGTATVQLSSDAVADEQLLEAVRSAGYQASVRARQPERAKETRP